MSPSFTTSSPSTPHAGSPVFWPRFIPISTSTSFCSDDWGTQAQTICPPAIYERLFLPYYGRINDTIHAIAPQIKTFLHSCGAIYDILDLLVDSGFDIINPVQWTAGGHSYQEWKSKVHGRAALWGGGVNAQQTLPLGTVADVRARGARDRLPHA